eukprot:262823_1
MDANKGEAERCLREAEKWLRQNRPVKALKFAKKSHSLFPTPIAQQKIGEITDLLQQRQFEFNAPPDPPHNSNPTAPPHDPAPPAAPSHPNTSPNQEFVEIDPNAVNNSSSPSFLENVLSFDFWTLWFETIFGECFGSIHRSLSPILPSFLLNFNLRYRNKVWLLLFIVIVLSFIRFAIIGHPFGAHVYDTPSKPYRYDKDNMYYAHNEDFIKKDSKPKSTYERAKEEYERKYPEKDKRKFKQDRHDYAQHNDRYNDEYKNYNSRSQGRYNNRNDRNYGTRPHQYSRHNSYRRDRGSAYSSWGGSMFSGYNMMWLLVIGSMMMGMFGNRNRNGNNGINWNMLAFLPMMFGGMPMGGFYGGFGRRRGRFGRRRRFFF